WLCRGISGVADFMRCAYSQYFRRCRRDPGPGHRPAVARRLELAPDWLDKSRLDKPKDCGTIAPPPQLTLVKAWASALGLVRQHSRAFQQDWSGPMLRIPHNAFVFVGDGSKALVLRQRRRRTAPQSQDRARLHRPKSRDPRTGDRSSWSRLFVSRWRTFQRRPNRLARP